MCLEISIDKEIQRPNARNGVSEAKKKRINSSQTTIQICHEQIRNFQSKCNFFGIEK
jgi:hypothetical protein